MRGMKRYTQVLAAAARIYVIYEFSRVPVTQFSHLCSPAGRKYERLRKLQIPDGKRTQSGVKWDRICRSLL